MTEPTVVRLNTPAQLVASIPKWLGYRPTNSLLLVCCHGSRGRVGLTMRYDLPHPELEERLVTEAIERIQLQDPSRLLIVVYTDEPGDRPRQHLVDRLRMEAEGVQISEAALVRGDRYWSYLCDDTRCCPVEGTPIDTAEQDSAVQLLAAEQALRGQAVAPSREDLAASLAGPDDDQALVQHFEAAAGVAAEQIRSLGRTESILLGVAGWRRMTARFQDPSATITDAEVAALAVAAEDVLVRDNVIGQNVDDPDALLVLLRAIVRRTPRDFEAPVCTMLAWLIYCHGGGAEVTILLDRVLTNRRDYSLAKLLTQCLLGQVPPSAVRGMTGNLAA